MSDGGHTPARRTDADAATAELIATVSHEIRSPLTTIKGFTKTLLDRWDRLDDDTKREMLAAINADADRVTRLLTELLDISRMEAGRLTLHRRVFDVRALAEQTARELEGRSDRHVVRVQEGGPVAVSADPDKVKQVVTNFIENALKYTEGGSVTVTCVTTGGSARLSVTDEGEGIPERRHATLFEKFTRHERPGSPSGTGLGLYICKGLIEAHGGHIGVESAPGRGSTFWFELPGADPEDLQ